jgi:Leucine-rich repeat (LRR) protein
VHNNHVSSLDALPSLSSLRILNLSSNHVSQLVDLSPLSRLAELNLHRNALPTLQLSVPPPRSCGASHPDQAVLPPGLHLPLPPSLQRLFLSHNNLRSVQELSGISHLKNLSELTSEGNQFFSSGHPTVRIRWRQCRACK